MDQYVGAPLVEVAISAQSACPQLQESSIVLPASWQYVLQYFCPAGAMQVQAGWAHFFWSAIRTSGR